ncbi:MAG: helix-turn-helix domain-containing protein [Bacteroidales bacterium]
MIQTHLLSVVRNSPELLFVPIYCGIIIYLVIMIFKNRANGYLKKIFITILSLICILLFKSDELGVLIVKYCLFTTPFIIMLFQRIGIINDKINFFIAFIAILWSVLLFVDIFKFFDIIPLRAYKPLLTVIAVSLNTFLTLYFVCKCNTKYDIIITDITKKIFQCILAVITIFILSTHIIILAAFEECQLYTSLPAFFMIFTIHAIFVYAETCNFAKIKFYKSSIKSYNDNYIHILEDENVPEESFVLVRLISLFENEKLYKHKDITISDIASKIYTNRTYLSKALNNRTSKNFNQFINYYRIRETCRLFINDSNYTMAQLFEQCGFSSLSSFTSAFKLNTGYTPAEWAKEIRHKQKNSETVELHDYFI